MSAVTGTDQSNSNFVFSVTTGVPSTYAAALSFNTSTTFLNTGTTDNVDLLHQKTYSLAGATQTIDLTSVLQPDGSSANFARVRFVRIRNKATSNTFVLTVGGGTNAWTSAWVTTMKVPPSTLSSDGTTIKNPGEVKFSAPNTTGFVVGPTNKLIVLDPGANTFDVDVIIAGSAS